MVARLALGGKLRLPHGFLRPGTWAHEELQGWMRAVSKGLGVGHGTGDQEEVLFPLWGY